MTGRMAKLTVELVQQSHSDTISYPAKKFVFPKQGFAARGIIVTKLLDWLLNHNMTTPGKLMVHGFIYDIKKNGAENKIEVVSLHDGVFLRKKDYVANLKGVKK